MPSDWRDFMIESPDRLRIPDACFAGAALENVAMIAMHCADVESCVSMLAGWSEHHAVSDEVPKQKVAAEEAADEGCRCL